MSTEVLYKEEEKVGGTRRRRKPHPGQFRKGEFKTKVRPADACEGPGCSNIVPSGVVAIRTKHYFCSELCDGRYHMARTTRLRGHCGHCGGEVCGYGRRPTEDGQIFCSRDHMYLHYRERAFGKGNPFRPLVEEYLATNTYYSKGTLPTVRVSLSNFFSFVFQQEDLTALEDIGSKVVSRFIVHERARGLTNGNFIGHISTFYRWLQLEELHDRTSPVVPRFHSQRGAPTEPRPYNGRDLAYIWDLFVACDNVALTLAAAIGKECGLRVGEVCNIRLSDVDREKQEIFVRLPTKNKRTRTVPYHDDVAKYLEIWLAKRDPACTHDHLLHTKHLASFDTNIMSTYLKDYLGDHPAPADSFVFHRLRHTWATTLINNGMELAVLKVLGGWESWNSMQRYIRVLDVTVQQQYQAACQKIQQGVQNEVTEVISLLDFAFMNTATDLTSTKQAA